MSATFWPYTIDGSGHLLEDSHRLRYQAYCLDRKFLSAENYPNQMELDDFDRFSVHVGVVDAEGELAGTARIVKHSSVGLPLFRHCTLFPHETRLDDVANTVVEISRVCISRPYARRRADVCVDGPEVEPEEPPILPHERRHRDAVFIALIKATYQASKRLGATHWIVAMEKPLLRRTARLGVPFRVAGPEVDYYGLVAPYIMNLAEFDQMILGGRIAMLGDFLHGLEPEFWPTLDEHDAPLCPTPG